MARYHSGRIHVGPRRPGYVQSGVNIYNGLGANWRLDEVSGSGLDSFGANTLTDNFTVTSSTGLVFPLARQFTAANSEYLSIADNAALSTGDIDFSIAAWAYLDSKLSDKSVIAKQDAGTAGNSDYLLLYLQSVDRFYAQINNAAGANVSVSGDELGSPSLATWYFIVMWHDSVANTINIQVNNGTVDSTAMAGLIPHDGSATVRIGAINSSPVAGFMDGRIGPVLFAKRVWSAAERTWLYNGGAGRAL